MWDLTRAGRARLRGEGRRCLLRGGEERVVRVVGDEGAF